MSTSFVVINAVTVPEERRALFEERFAKRAGKVQSQPGFQAFELMRPTDGNDKYLVYTRWDDQASFMNWMKSADFGAGHSQHAEGGPAGTASEIWTFDLIEGQYAS